MAPHAEINPQDITERARRDLLQLLEGVPGKKNLVIEKSLAGPIGLLVKFSTLQEYGVDKVFYVENRNVDDSQRNIVFLARGEKPKDVQLIAEHISQIRQESKIDHEFSVFWVPRRTLVSDRILEENGVLGEVTIGECPLFLIPLEPDLLSLELEDAFSDLYLRKDPTSIFLTATALMRLQRSTGLFPRILGKGDNAKKLADLLIRMRSEEEVSASSATSKSPSTFGLTPSAIVENVIIIDREIDFFTPLMTQLTYEGLIDEVFGVRNNQTEVDTSIVGAAPQQQKPQGAAAAAGNSTQAATKRKIQLDSSDKLYPELRDCNFAVVGPLLNRTARRLQADYESRHKADQSISDLKTFVAKLPSYQAEQASLKIHTSMAEEIMKTTRSEIFGRVLEVQQNFAAGADPNSMNDNLEELIARDVPLSTILRLLSLESCVGGGIRPRELENLKRQVMYAYGHQHLTTFAALEKMGLVCTRQSNTGYLNPMGGVFSGNTDYNAVRKTLKLFVDEVDEQEPTDISYVFSGYAPLSVRLVQCVLQKQLLAKLSNPRSSSTPNANAAVANVTPNTQAAGWKGFEDVLQRIKGATVDEVQKGSSAEASAARQTLRGGNGGGCKTTIVVFLGGVTFAEIAALRFMGEQLGEKKKIVIVTTGILSGNAAVEAAMEKRAWGRK
ncbi:Sec1-like protein [Aureobasidium sp. EXF-3400]|nr:Sec1-like protein [Aureobasidium sp. EXF-12344]KAI4773790.1 Sec1-like protein [Aureobasidium sp. EXF-3400]